MKNSRTLADKEVFSREKQYLAAMAVAESMLKRNILSEKKLSRINTILLKKHRPIISTLLLGKALYARKRKSSATVTVRQRYP